MGVDGVVEHAVGWWPDTVDATLHLIQLAGPSSTAVWFQSPPARPLASSASIWSVSWTAAFVQAGEAAAVARVRLRHRIGVGEAGVADLDLTRSATQLRRRAGGPTGTTPSPGDASLPPSNACLVPQRELGQPAQLGGLGCRGRHGHGRTGWRHADPRPGPGRGVGGTVRRRTRPGPPRPRPTRGMWRSNTRWVSAATAWPRPTAPIAPPREAGEKSITAVWAGVPTGGTVNGSAAARIAAAELARSMASSMSSNRRRRPSTRLTTSRALRIAGLSSHWPSNRPRFDGCGRQFGGVVPVARYPANCASICIRAVAVRHGATRRPAPRTGWPGPRRATGGRVLGRRVGCRCRRCRPRSRATSAPDVAISLGEFVDPCLLRRLLGEQLVQLVGLSGDPTEVRDVTDLGQFLVGFGDGVLGFLAVP